MQNQIICRACKSVSARRLTPWLTFAFRLKPRPNRRIRLATKQDQAVRGPASARRQARDICLGRTRWSTFIAASLSTCVNVVLLSVMMCCAAALQSQHGAISMRPITRACASRSAGQPWPESSLPRSWHTRHSIVSLVHA